MAANELETGTFAPTDPYRRETETFPELTDDQVQRATRFGTVDDLPAGAVLFTRGERTVDFFIVLSGCVEIFDEDAGAERVLTRHGAKQFTGELDLFSDRKILVGGRMGEAGRVVRVCRADCRKLLLAEPDIGDVVMKAFILRRIGLIGHEQGGGVLVGSRTSSDSLRIERFLRRNGHPVRSGRSTRTPTTPRATCSPAWG